MKEMIERKNALLKEAYEKLSNIRKIALAMGGITFDTPEAADVYVEVMSRVISELTLGRFGMLEESQKTEPEAEEVSYVPPAEEEMTKAREVYGDD